MNRILPALLCLAAPAWAVQQPKPVASGRLVCEVAYDPNDVIAMNAVIGDQVTLQLGKEDHIEYLALLDDKTLVNGTVPDKNGAYAVFKAKKVMPPQVISIQFRHADGPLQQLTIQYITLPDVSPSTSKQVADASGALPPVAAAEDVPKPCYVVRVTFPKQEAEDKAAKVKVQWTNWKEKQAEIALHKAAQEVPCRADSRYDGQGDHALDPVWICDTGFTTRLRFAKGIPAIFGVDAEGKDIVLSGYTVTDNGRVDLHQVPVPAKDEDGHEWPVIRLRIGEQVLCIFNRNYQPSDPQTGTTSPEFKREVNTK